MSVPFSARALFDYSAVEPTELSVTLGELVLVEEVNESGWCLAKCGERTGWLPTDYIERLEGEEVLNAEPEPELVSVKSDYRSVSTSGTTTTNNNNNNQYQQQSTISSNNQSSNDINTPLSQLKIQSGNNNNSSSNARSTVPAATVDEPDNADSKYCASCNQSIKSAFVMAKDKLYHPEHFQCTICRTELGGKAYLERDDKFYCEEDYYSSFNPKCGACQSIIKGPYISALDQSWHPDHFVCTECQSPFPGNQFRKHQSKPYCEKCFGKMHAPKCAKCNLPIQGQIFEALDNKYHLECFNCSFNNHPIGEGVMFHVHEGAVYCPEHFEELFLSKCKGCKKIIKGQYIKIMDEHFHSECWKCAHCEIQLKPDTAGTENGNFYCRNCLEAGTLELKGQAAINAKNGGNSTTTTTTAAPCKPSPAASTASSAPKSTFSANKSAPNHTAPAKPHSAAPSRISPAAPTASTYTSSTAAVNLNDPDSAVSRLLSSQPVYSDPGSSESYNIELLKVKSNQKPAAVNPAIREQYLNDNDFKLYFKMTKPEFDKLAQWKKAELKKALDLF